MDYQRLFLLVLEKLEVPIPSPPNYEVRSEKGSLGVKIFI